MSMISSVGFDIDSRNTSFAPGPERRPPLFEVGAVDEAHLDAEARQQRLADEEAGAEERPRRHHAVAGLEQGEERAVHRLYAGTAVAKASSAPSSIAMRSSNMRTVGLP